MEKVGDGRKLEQSCRFTRRITPGDIRCIMVTIGSSAILYTWNLVKVWNLSFITLSFRRQNSGKLCEVMDMILRFIVIILECIFILKLHIVHLKFIQDLLVNYKSIKLGVFGRRHALWVLFRSWVRTCKLEGEDSITYSDRHGAEMDRTREVRTQKAREKQHKRISLGMGVILNLETIQIEIEDFCVKRIWIRRGGW